MVERIAITGLGMVSAAGRGLAANLERLKSGESALGPLDLFDSPRCGHFPVGQFRDALSLPEAPRSLALAEMASREALQGAGLAGLDESQSEGLAIALGICVGGMPETEGSIEKLLAGDACDDSVWNTHECGATTARLAQELGARGATMTLSTACSSGAQAIACGADLLEAGAARYVLAGGVDALCHLTLNGFASLLAMDPEGCRPFDRERAGMSLGEGAGFVVLERESEARARGKAPLAFVAGFGNTCDAYHATAPHPEGEGAERAMRTAIERAAWSLDSIDFVSAHGTGTRDNDLAEGRALRRLFGDGLPPVASIKGCLGHSLAASGAIEAVFSVLCMSAGFVPPNARFGAMDPEIGFEAPRHAEARVVQRVLSNSFGFGGNNTVLCLEAAN